MTTATLSAFGNSFSPPASARPITFRPESVAATIANLKTQFRIPFNQQPDGEKNVSILNHISRTHIANFAPYQPGDILWVRETWAVTPERHDQPQQLLYKATEDMWRDNPFIRWQSPAAMPQDFCRLYLRITRTRAQRIQEITVEDAISEGIHPDQAQSDRLAMETFELQWNRQNASDHEFAINPWVFAYDFEIAHVDLAATHGR